MELQKCRGFTLEDGILKGPDTPVDLISLNIGEVLLDAFDKNPNHVSQIDSATNCKTTYAEMKDRSVRCALWLEKQGVCCDDVISVFTHIHLDTYVPVFATYFAQAVLNIWKCRIHTYSTDQVRDWLELFAPKLIFACTYAVDVLEAALSQANLSAKIVVIGEHPRYPSLSEIIESQSSGEVENYRPSSRKSPQEPAVIVVSSGSTGFPKGFVISAETLLRNALDYGFDLRRKNAWWYGSPLSVANNSTTITCVLRNATRIVSRYPIDSREFCRIVEKFEVSYAHVTPGMLDSLMRFAEIDEYNLNCLEVIRTGGSKLNRALFDKLGSSCLRGKIYQGYGTTEIGTGRVLPKVGQKQQSHNSVGFVASNIQLKIADRATGETLGANALGEIRVKTPTKMLGYYRKPELTKKSIDAEGWFRSGDLGYYDETGEIFLVGRISDAFEYRGREFFSSEIEDILWEHPAVMDLAVVPVRSKSNENVAVAFVVLRSGENVAEDEISGLLENVEKLKTLPLVVQFLSTMPLTPVSKISKVRLTEFALKLIE